MYDHVLVAREDGERTLTIFPSGSAPITADSTHPNFEALLDAAQDFSTTVADLENLADPANLVGQKLEPLSERVSVGNGRVFFDGDPIHDAIADHILRFLDEDLEDWRPLVRFAEKLYTNPNEHSREQLYEWLNDRQFTITQSGDFIAYKGVALDGEGGYVSVHSGTAIVDGTTVSGRIPNAVGSTIEMPRSQVAFDPAVGCSTGLHAGTYEYAKGYASGALLRVAINPRDVVSVPTDTGAAKIRTSRYVIQAIIDAPETAPVIYDDEDEECEDPNCYCHDDREW